MTRTIRYTASLSALVTMAVTCNLLNPSNATAQHIYAGRSSKELGFTNRAIECGFSVDGVDNQGRAFHVPLPKTDDVNYIGHLELSLDGQVVTVHHKAWAIKYTIEFDPTTQAESVDHQYREWLQSVDYPAEVFFNSASTCADIELTAKTLFTEGRTWQNLK